MWLILSATPSARSQRHCRRRPQSSWPGRTIASAFATASVPGQRPATEHAHGPFHTTVRALPARGVGVAAFVRCPRPWRRRARRRQCHGMPRVGCKRGGRMIHRQAQIHLAIQLLGENRRGQLHLVLFDLLIPTAMPCASETWKARRADRRTSALKTGFPAPRFVRIPWRRQSPPQTAALARSFSTGRQVLLHQKSAAPAQNTGTPTTDAWARWEAPKASFTYRSHPRPDREARSSPLLSSRGSKRRFSSTRICPGCKAAFGGEDFAAGHTCHQSHSPPEAIPQDAAYGRHAVLFGAFALVGPGDSRSLAPHPPPNARIVGSAARIRVSSVMMPSFEYALKSTRRKTASCPNLQIAQGTLRHLRRLLQARYTMPRPAPHLARRHCTAICPADSPRVNRAFARIPRLRRT